MRKSVPFAVPIARLLRRVPIVALIVMLLPGLNLTIETRAQSARAESLIGYTELNTNLTGGRHANIITMRAVVSRADGTDRRLVAEELVREPNSWTQFAGWSPDGRLAIIGRGWEDPENGRWEEEHKQFRHTAAGWLYDMFLVNLATGANTNVTAVDRVSFYNTGLFFWPGDPTKLGFQAIVDGNSHPFQMDRDGKNKRDLTKDSQEFAYGFSGSPDGRRIAYHKSYQVYVADADGSNAHKISTGQPFRITLEGPSEVSVRSNHTLAHGRAGRLTVVVPRGTAAPGLDHARQHQSCSPRPGLPSPRAWALSLRSPGSGSWCNHPRVGRRDGRSGRRRPPALVRRKRVGEPRSFLSTTRTTRRLIRSAPQPALATPETRAEFL
jgi:hypothetical protein